MSKLSELYADLEKAWGEWILEAEAERAKLRLAKSDEELRAFYDALQPQMPALIDFMGRHPIDALPADVKNLWWLISSYIGVAVAIEIYGSVRAIPGGYLFCDSRPVESRNALQLLQ